LPIGGKTLPDLSWILAPHQSHLDDKRLIWSW